MVGKGERDQLVIIVVCPDVNLEEKNIMVYPMRFTPISKSENDLAKFNGNISLVIEFTYILA